MKALTSIKKISTILAIAGILLACEEFVTIDPPDTTLSTVTVFEDEVTARAAVNRIYINMMQSFQSFSSGAISLNNMGGMSADEFINFNTLNDMAAFANNEVSPVNANINSSWNQIYNLIYQANAVLEGLENSSLPASAKTALEGEARFMRTYFHFLLVNFWGDIPWITTTDYSVNATTVRTPVTEVYQNMIAELTLAKQQLPSESTQRIRPTSYAATALLARVHLYNRNDVAAEELATEIISQFPLEPDLNKVFLIASKEIIFQLQSIVPGYNTWDGDSYILIAAPRTAALTQSFLNGFEPGDARRTSWVSRYTLGTTTWYFPFKYKVRRLPTTTSPKTEYQVIFRAGEQYLIRAEARANQGKLSAAAADLNIIRSRANLSPTAATTQAELLLAIEKERRIELFSESAHRWLDLKRTGRLDAVIGPMKPQWQSTDALFPIPQNECARNSNMIQNPGY